MTEPNTLAFASMARRSITLLQIGEEMSALAALLDQAADERDGELTVDDAAVLDKWFAELDANLATKADGYASLIREREMRAAACKEEAERLQKRAAADLALAKRLKERLRVFMQDKGIRKIEGKRPITLCANGGKQPLEMLAAPDQLPPELQRVTVEADTEAVRLLLETDLAAGSRWARLLPRGQHVRIG